MSGFGILLNVHDTNHHHLQYGALFLLTCGCFSTSPVFLCWFGMNLGGHRRRLVGTAFQIGVGNSMMSLLLQIPLLISVSRREESIINKVAFANKSSRRHNRNIRVPGKRRPTLSQRIHHRALVLLLLGRHVDPIPCRMLVREYQARPHHGGGGSWRRGHAGARGGAGRFGGYISLCVLRFGISSARQSAIRILECVLHTNLPATAGLQ
jgi:hypothetical protein